MILTIQCKFCESYNVIINNGVVICTSCKEEYVTKKKKINVNKSINKLIHCKNVLNDMAYNNNPIDKEMNEEINHKIRDIDKDFLSTSLISEYLKTKNIKSYKQTFRLLNSCKKITMTNECFNIPKILIIFDSFINYLFYTKYKGTISYNDTLHRILKSLGITDNLKPSYTKSSNKKDYRDKLWNDFILYSKDKCNNLPKFKYINNYKNYISENLYNLSCRKVINFD